MSFEIKAHRDGKQATPPDRPRWGRIGRGLGALGLVGLVVAPAQAAPFAYVVGPDDTLAALDTATNTVVATVPVGRGPWGAAVHSAGTFVYVASYQDQTISVVDTASLSVVATVAVGYGPLSLTVHPAGTFVYVAHDDSWVSVLDTQANAVVATIPVPWSMDAAFRGIAVHPAGTTVYVANAFDNTISLIDTATHSVVKTIPAGPRLGGIAVHPAGTFVYVTNGPDIQIPPRLGGGNTASVIDTATTTIVAAVPVGDFPAGVAVHPAGTFVYTANFGSSTVSVIDTAAHAVVATVPVGANPLGIAAHPAGTSVYVANDSGQSLSVIDTATNRVASTVPWGSRPLAFGQFIGPRLPGVSLTLNGTAFKPGAPLVLTATTYAGDRTGPVDAYLELRLPDGTVRFAQLDGSFTTERRPLVSRWAVEALRKEIVRHTFSGAEPAGSYAWRAYFTEPGTSDVIGLVAAAAFSAGP